VNVTVEAQPGPARFHEAADGNAADVHVERCVVHGAAIQRRAVERRAVRGDMKQADGVVEAVLTGERRQIVGDGPARLRVRTPGGRVPDRSPIPRDAAR